MDVLKQKASTKISYNNFQAASTLDRLSAQLIDLFFLLGASLAASYYAGTDGLFLTLALSAGYFWLCHQFWGQTLGKKIIGIHVISANAPSLNFLRLFLRETIGRVLCTATALLGYLPILVRKDGRGLHDFISASIVVNKKNAHTSLAYFVGIVFSISVTLGLASYYLFFKTPLLATMGMHILKSQGMEISSLTGNIDSGWKVDVFQGKNSLFNFSLRGIHIKQDKMGFYRRGAWKVQQITIDEATFRLAPNALNFNYFDRTPTSFSFISPTVQLPFLLKAKALIEALTIKKLTIVNEQNLNLVLEGLNSNQISYESGIVSANQLQTAKTSPNQLEATQFIFYVEQNKLLLKAKLLAKKEVYPLLKKDLQASVSWSGPLNKPERMRVVAFENRFVVDYFQNDFTLTLTDFTPAKHIAASPSFSNIQAKLKNSNCLNITCLKYLQGRGSFFINKQKVDFKNNEAWFAGITEDVQPFNYNDLVLATFSPRTVLSVVSEESPSNFISQLYFQKNISQLAPEEQALVRRDLVYFKVLKERFDPNRPRHIDTFLLRSPSELTESK